MYILAFHEENFNSFKDMNLKSSWKRLFMYLKRLFIWPESQYPLFVIEFLRVQIQNCDYYHAKCPKAHNLVHTCSTRGKKKHPPVLNLSVYCCIS